MSLESALRAGRAAAERQMTDSGIMRRPTGNTVLDEATGRETPEYEDVFTSKAKIQTRGLASRDSDVGGRIATEIRLELHLPIDAPAVKVDDVWEHTGAGPMSDPQLVGRTFRVVAPVGKSYATARRIDVEEVVS